MNADEGAGGVWWLHLFLARTFFQACTVHDGGNLHNHYCIDCETAACQHCVEQDTHSNHRVIKIYRLVYKDVVTYDQMNRYINCSHIQPYSSNGKQVLALQPLPHNRSGELNQKTSCQTCQRRLMNPHRYNFCSIACKFQMGNDAGDGAADDDGHGGGGGRGDGAGGRGGRGDGGAGGSGSSGGADAAGTRKTRLDSSTSRRKGVPSRAPLF